MNPIDPALALIGMTMTVAAEDALDSIVPLREAWLAVPEDAIGEHAAACARAVRACLDAGTPPTGVNLRDAEPELNAAFFAEARRAADAEDGYNSIPAAAAEVVYRHRSRTVWEASRAAQAALKGGDLDAALNTLAALNFGELRGHAAQLKDFLDHDLDAEDEARAFPLSHAELNQALGGGLGAGGPYGLSLWVAPSGHGKSSFWWGEAPHQLRRENWVIFLAAEADAAYIFSQIVRLEAGVTDTAFAKRHQIPHAARQAHEARARIAGYVGRGQLQVWDEPFGPDTVRELAEAKLAEMRRAGATGKLIVIVDNYDGLFENVAESKLTGPEAVNREMQRLQRHTKEHGYHIALLAQASSEAEKEKGPCAASDVYGNRKLHMKVAHMVTMYRPKSEEDLRLKDASGEPHLGSKAWLAVRKKRGPGREGALIEMEAANHLGAWKEAGALPI